MNIIRKPRGTQDIHSERMKIMKKIVEVAKDILEKNNCKELIFPTFESSDLFRISLGSMTDIVHKEMFVFKDKKGREMTLRPEGTVCVARLVCENNLLNRNESKKFFYLSNMFRYERPQKGRYREFWQLGLEFVNSHGIFSDFQTIEIASKIVRALGIREILSINFLGNDETRNNYKEKLKKYILEKEILLCKDCERKYIKNALRILDCSKCSKNNFPPYNSSWNEEDIKHVRLLEKFLLNSRIEFDYDNRLVRGLDYYTGIIFELKNKEGKAMLGGGRYDNLYKKIDKFSNFPSIGFAFGIERLIDYVIENREISIWNELNKKSLEILIIFYELDDWEKAADLKDKVNILGAHADISMCEKKEDKNKRSTADIEIYSEKDGKFLMKFLKSKIFYKKLSLEEVLREVKNILTKM